MRALERSSVEAPKAEWLDRSREAIGARLQIIRMENGLTQADFARKLAISRPSYYYYEKGRRALSADQIALLDAEFEVDLNWLITGNCAVLTTIDPSMVEKTKSQLDNYIARAGVRLSSAKRRAILSGALRRKACGEEAEIAFLVGMLR